MKIINDGQHWLVACASGEEPGQGMAERIFIVEHDDGEVWRHGLPGAGGSMVVGVGLSIDGASGAKRRKRRPSVGMTPISFH